MTTGPCWWIDTTTFVACAYLPALVTASDTRKYSDASITSGSRRFGTVGDFNRQHRGSRERVDRAAQPGFGEPHRVKPARQLAQLRVGGRELAARLREQLDRVVRRAVQRAAREIEQLADRHELLLCPVVQVARDPRGARHRRPRRRRRGRPRARSRARGARRSRRAGRRRCAGGASSRRQRACHDDQPGKERDVQDALDEAEDRLQRPHRARHQCRDRGRHDPCGERLAWSRSEEIVGAANAIAVNAAAASSQVDLRLERDRAPRPHRHEAGDQDARRRRRSTARRARSCARRRSGAARAPGTRRPRRACTTIAR